LGVAFERSCAERVCHALVLSSLLFVPKAHRRSPRGTWPVE